MLLTLKSKYYTSTLIDIFLKSETFIPSRILARLDLTPAYDYFNSSLILLHFYRKCFNTINMACQLINSIWIHVQSDKKIQILSYKELPKFYHRLFTKLLCDDTFTQKIQWYPKRRNHRSLCQVCSPIIPYTKHYNCSCQI